MNTVSLRPVEDSDFEVIFELMRDPLSVHMAAFTAEDPSDRNAFNAHLEKILSSSANKMRVISRDDRVVGTIASFPSDGVTEVTYWIERSCWGQGIASTALELLLKETGTRPLRARAASDNVGSLRVLEKSGFRPVRTDVGFASGRSGEIEETILELS